MSEIRCGNKKVGELTPDGILEMFCRSALCKTSKNEVVLHRWDTRKFNADGTVKLIETRRFKKPLYQVEGKQGK